MDELGGHWPQLEHRETGAPESGPSDLGKIVGLAIFIRKAYDRDHGNRNELIDDRQRVVNPRLRHAPRAGVPLFVPLVRGQATSGSTGTYAAKARVSTTP